MIDVRRSLPARCGGRRSEMGWHLAAPGTGASPDEEGARPRDFRPATGAGRNGEGGERCKNGAERGLLPRSLALGARFRAPNSCGWPNPAWWNRLGY